METRENGPASLRRARAGDEHQGGLLRSNPLKAALRRGESLLGAKLTMCGNPAVMFLLKSVGVDYVEVDATRSMMSTEDVGALALVGRALDLPVLIRVGSPRRDLITRLLDSGAWGLSVAGVATAVQAREVVDAVRHAPMGSRGTFEPGPQNDFAPDPQDLQHVSAETHLTIILDGAEGLANAAVIAAIPGVDAIEMDAPPWPQAINDSGCVVSGAASDLDGLRSLLKAGARMICLGDEATLLERGFASSVARIRASAEAVSA